MFAEAFHRVFKYNYLKSKVNKRVDAALFHLNKFNRDKTFDRIIKLTKGKCTGRTNLIFSRHQLSLELSFNNIWCDEDSSNEWNVKSESHEGKTYLAQKIVMECKNSSCRLKCSECNACFHMFVCNCADALINSTLCKHAHLVQHYLTERTHDNMTGVD